MIDTMIRDNNAVYTVFHSFLSILSNLSVAVHRVSEGKKTSLDTLNTLEHDWPLPVVFQQLEVLPGFIMTGVGLGEP